MRTVQVKSPSFPAVEPNSPLLPKSQTLWQVLCGDSDHWRLGLYSPREQGAADLRELEKHDCPEVFWLLSGKLTLLLARNRKLEELPLEIGKPVLVTVPHAGFCPDGPHKGQALVVERDTFTTEYRPIADWLGDQTIPYQRVPEI